MGTKNAKDKKSPQEIKEETQPQEQLDLIDVTPENSRKIVACAKRYKVAQRQRLAALEDETAEKQKLLGLIKEANLQRLDDGTIKYSVEGYTIRVQPRDELITVKDETDQEESE